MQAIIIFLSGALALNLGLAHLRKQSAWPARLPVMVSCFRFSCGVLSALLVVLQRVQYAFLIFVFGCASYTINFPRPVLKRRGYHNTGSKQQERYVTLSTIADMLFTAPQLMSLIYVQDQSYQIVIDFLNRIPVGFF